MSKFTEQALGVVSDAQDLARRRGDTEVTALHLLTVVHAEPEIAVILKAAGLTDEMLRRAGGADEAGLPRGDGDALESLGVDVQDIQAAVDARLGEGTFKDAGQPRPGGATSLFQAMRRSRDSGVGFADDAKTALQATQAHGIRLGAKDLGPELIALALLDSPNQAIRDLTAQLDRAAAVSSLEAAARTR